MRLKSPLIACALLAVGSGHRAAFAALPSVSLSYESPEQRRAAERLAWELRSEGYAVAWEDADRALPCDAANAPSSAGSPEVSAAQAEPHAWIRVQPHQDGAWQARICYRSAQGGLYDAVSTPHSSAPRELALQATEALNGLRARLAERDVSPSASKAPLPSTPVLPRPAAAARSRLTLYGGPLLAVSTGGVGPLLGPQAGLDVRLGSRLSLVIDGFASIASDELAAPDRRLFVRVAWFRIGPSFASTIGPFELRLQALAGAALVRVTAHAEAPRVGGSDQTGSVQLSLGAKLGYPLTKSWFLYGGAQSSTFLPRVRFELGSEGHAELGEVIVEAAFGVGVRMP